MKLIKIKQDYYVVADETNINVGDCITDKYKVWKWNDDCSLLGRKKITHSTNVSIEDYWNVIEISLSEVKQLIGEVDVEKKATEEILYNDQKREWWKQGYVKALEDNKDKKYTEEQIIWAIQEAYGDGKNYEFDNNEIDETIESIKKFLQSKTEWDVQFDENGKLKLK